MNQDRILRALKTFFNRNKLAVNEGKAFLTEFMSKQKRGRTKGQAPELDVDDDKNTGQIKTLNDSKNCRFLGLNLQNSFSCSDSWRQVPRLYLTTLESRSELSTPSGSPCPDKVDIT